MSVKDKFKGGAQWTYDKVTSGGGLNFFIVFAFIIHIVDLLAFGLNPGYRPRYVLHAIVTIIAFFIFTQNRSKARAAPWFLVYYFIAVYFIYIGNYVASLTNWVGSPVLTVTFAAFTNAFFVPFWLYYAAIIQSSVPKTKFSGGILWILTIFWILAIVTTAVTDADMVWGGSVRISAEQKSIAMQVVGSVKDGGALLWKAITIDLPKNIWKGTNETKNWILGDEGDYFTGEVDSNAEEELGVYLEEIEPADPELYTDEPITIYARLKARTLDEPISIAVSCDSQGVPPAGVNPQSFYVDRYEDENLDCYFNKGTFQEGDRVFSFNAQFNFKTLAYLKTYIMDKETMKSLRREELDPLDQYGVKDKNPIAVYTNGPLMIGIDAKTPPIGLDRELEYTRFLIGYTLKNDWDGEVTEVTDVVLILPTGFSMIEDVSGSETWCGGYNFEDIKCGDIEDSGDWCDDKLFRIYRIVQGEGHSSIGNIKDYKSLRCQVEAKKSDYDQILSSAPVTVRFFRVIVSYNYKLTGTTSVDIKQGADVKEEIHVYSCSGVDLKKEEGLPGSDFQSRYPRYQELAAGAVETNDPDDLTDEQAEALIAAVMTSVSGMGNKESDSDDVDDTPDYVTGCWKKHATNKNSAEMDINCLAFQLKSFLDKNDGDIAKALDEYAEYGELDFDRTNALHYYYQWLNKLCGVTEEEIEEGHTSGNVTVKFQVTPTGDFEITSGDKKEFNASIVGDIPDITLSYRWSFKHNDIKEVARENEKKGDDLAKDSYTFDETTTGDYALSLELVDTNEKVHGTLENFATVKVVEEFDG